MSSAEAPQKIPIYPFLTKTADGATGGAEEGAKSTKDGSEKFQSEASSSEVPECVLRAIYPERYNDSNQPSGTTSSPPELTRIRRHRSLPRTHQYTT